MWASIKIAEQLFMTLSPNQRKKLEDLLSIQYDGKFVDSEDVFKVSIRRNHSCIETFVEEQKIIKNLMQSPIDMTKVITNQKDFIKRKLDELSHN